MIEREKLIEHIARRLWFETVDAEGYPNGMLTWDEMVASTTSKMNDTNRRFIIGQQRTIALYLSMAEGALEIVEGALEMTVPKGTDTERS